MAETAVTSGYQDTTIDDLRAEHQGLESRLRRLDKHRSLSPEEQYEMQVIKKRKLAIKDEINKMESAY